MNYRQVKSRLDDKIKEFRDARPKQQIVDGDFKYKRCTYHILILFIPKGIQTNESRKKVVDLRFAKFRAARAYCVAIFNPYLNRFYSSYYHWFKLNVVVYEVGKWAVPDGFDVRLDVVCTHGIHYFNALLAAYCYTDVPVQEAGWVDIHENGSVHRIVTQEGIYYGSSSAKILNDWFGFNDLFFCSKSCFESSRKKSF